MDSESIQGPEPTPEPARIPDPPCPGQAHAEHAYALDVAGHAREAEAAYRAAVASGYASSEVLTNLGLLLAAQKRFDEAEASYRQAIAANPQSSAAWSNWGVLQIACKREAEAEDQLRTALSIDPANAKAHFNLSYLLLRQGRFDEGWQCFEARDWYAPMERYFQFPRWAGEPLVGRALLVSYEAGHGDVIQFCRYLALLKEYGPQRISLICHPALKPLLHGLQGADEIIGFDEPIAATGWDYWMPLMSAPYHCQTRADSIPARIPYLFADARRVAHWAADIPQDGLRIGLAWRGNPKFDNDADRSLPSLATLAPLWRVPGTRYISLQKGAGESEGQHPPADQPLVHLGSRMADFADAAAIVSQLDLVICVDTALAHLAGALGKPCWVLLPDYMSDWRWGNSGNQSAWYPGSMRLFRQTRAGDWGDVVLEVAAALRQLSLDA